MLPPVLWMRRLLVDSRIIMDCSHDGWIFSNHQFLENSQFFNEFFPTIFKHSQGKGIGAMCIRTAWNLDQHGPRPWMQQLYLNYLLCGLPELLDKPNNTNLGGVSVVLKVSSEHIQSLLTCRSLRSRYWLFLLHMYYLANFRKWYAWWYLGHNLQEHKPRRQNNFRELDYFLYTNTWFTVHDWFSYNLPMQTNSESKDSGS